MWVTSVPTHYASIVPGGGRGRVCGERGSYVFTAAGGVPVNDSDFDLVQGMTWHML